LTAVATLDGSSSRRNCRYGDGKERPPEPRAWAASIHIYQRPDAEPRAVEALRAAAVELGVA